ncbi:DNA-directed RNA polymerase subunit beta', partial [Striga asiatica]
RGTALVLANFMLVVSFDKAFFGPPAAGVPIVLQRAEHFQIGQSKFRQQKLRRKKRREMGELNQRGTNGARIGRGVIRYENALHPCLAIRDVRFRSDGEETGASTSSEVRTSTLGGGVAVDDAVIDVGEANLSSLDDGDVDEARSSGGLTGGLEDGEGGGGASGDLVELLGADGADVVNADAKGEDVFSLSAIKCDVMIACAGGVACADSLCEKRPVFSLSNRRRFDTKLLYKNQFQLNLSNGAVLNKMEPLEECHVAANKWVIWFSYKIEEDKDADLRNGERDRERGKREEGR